jgi:hypothetical protein
MSQDGVNKYPTDMAAKEHQITGAIDATLIILKKTATEPLSL